MGVVCDQRITTVPTMAHLALLLLGANLAAAAVVNKEIFPVPDPYRWDESFTVKMPQIDDEHRGLFNGILLIERENTEENLKAATIKYHDHGIFEEGLFKQTMSREYIKDHRSKHNAFLARFDAWTSPVPDDELYWAKDWLVQHIKNTDFKYIGQLPYHVPKPYHWDDSVEVFYHRLDAEHKELFDHIRYLGHAPDSTEDLENLKGKMRAHFDYERGLFCNSETYNDCEEHSNKHDRFFKQLYALQVPVPMEDIDWAKNWLVQHIINTDFQYKHKLNAYKHKVPRPYVWQPYLSVYYDRLDDEHVGLFKAIRDSVEHPADADKYAFLIQLMKDHFVYEQGEFMKIPNFEEYSNDHIAKHDRFLAQLESHSVPLDCDFINYLEDWLVQHIMNTDFAYRGKMVHDVPEPYIWDTSFMTFYKRIDDEHKVLFDCIRDCAENPSDATKVAFCKTKLRMHFDYEESEFCKVPGYDCHGHYIKHYNFQTQFQAASLPLSADVTNWAKNWLAQHIKNTDFGYRGKLFVRRHYVVPEPYEWDPSFLVDYKQLDDEHVGLFDVVREIEADRDSQETWDKLLKLYQDHFTYEEGQFTLIENYDAADHRHRHMALMKTVAGAVLPITEEITEFIKNWLAQHIKNTDFKYKGKMIEIHPIPEPFKWNSFFAVYYKDMDDEHKPLFSCISDVEANPNDGDLLASCLKSYEVHFTRLDDEHKVLFRIMQQLKDNPDDEDVLNNNRDVFRDHFDYEEKQFMACGEPCDADAHKKKHDIFFKTLTWVTNPVSTEYMDFAMNWLAQHIKNTDFKYRYKLATNHKTPEPYIWNEEFQVSYKRLDDEHIGLFESMYDVEMNLRSQEKVDNLQRLMRDHFYYEEAQYCDALDLPWDYCKEHKKKHVKFSERFAKLVAPVDMAEIKWAQNWLAQHIKNTDFGYKGHLKHEVPEPYVWDTSFAVDYSRLDSEHNVLFANILDVSQHPDDQAKLDVLKENMRLHFDYEQQRFCAVPNFNCVDHKMKHYKFFVVLEDLHAPTGCEEINWAKNWLAQHIKNTDHQYKTRLVGPDSGTDFSGVLP